MAPEFYSEGFVLSLSNPTLKSTLAGDSMAQFLRCHCLANVAVVLELLTA